MSLRPPMQRAKLREHPEVARFRTLSALEITPPMPSSRSAGLSQFVGFGWSALAAQWHRSEDIYAWTKCTVHLFSLHVFHFNPEGTKCVAMDLSPSDGAKQM